MRCHPMALVANKGILKPVKTGNKVLYPEYEVRKALGQRNINI